MADTYHEIICGDCLEVMKWLPDKSVDMVLCDLPYGTTSNTWDVVIPFEALWEQYGHILKPGGVIALTASQPFTSKLVASCYEWFRYELIWRKNTVTGHLQSKVRPLKAHENILVFGPNVPCYYPQGLKPFGRMSGGANNQSTNWSNRKPKGITEFTGYPRSVLDFDSEHKPVHPTQKPIALWEYLIRTYTNPGDTVLDNCCGSGTTGVACYNTGRNSIQIDISQEYCDIARKRLAEVQQLQQPTVNKGE